MQRSIRNYRIEEEVNGILSYDRKIVKIDENVVREWNEKLHF